MTRRATKDTRTIGYLTPTQAEVYGDLIGDQLRAGHVVDVAGWLIALRTDVPPALELVQQALPGLE